MADLDCRRHRLGVAVCAKHCPSGAVIGPGSSHKASNVVPCGSREVPLSVRLHAFADPAAAVAAVRAEGLIKPTGIYRQEYVLFLRATAGKIAFLREYFDPVRAAMALDAPIVGVAIGP